MKSDDEYKRTLYDKYEKMQMERRITRKNTWISSLSAAACLLLVFVFLASPLADLFHPRTQTSPTQIMIASEDIVLRTYTDTETISSVCSMLNELSLSITPPAVSDGETLYTVTAHYPDGTEEILYHAEKDGDVGIQATSPTTVSMRNILNQYPSK